MSTGYLVWSSIILTALLFLKCFITNMIGAVLKGYAGLRAPEDRQNRKPTPIHIERWSRMERIISNDQENIPIGLIVLWACVATILAAQKYESSFDSVVNRHVFLATIFVMVRICHTIVYWLAIRKARMMAYLIGILALFGLLFNAILTAWKIPA